MVPARKVVIKGFRRISIVSSRTRSRIVDAQSLYPHNNHTTRNTTKFEWAPLMIDDDDDGKRIMSEPNAYIPR